MATGQSEQEKRDLWLQGWTDFMVTIWREKMQSSSPPVRRTGALENSLKGELHPGPTTTIEHRFAEYGVFVSRGVTPSFAWKQWTSAHGGQKVPRERTQGGRLEILDPQYRHEHGLDRRKKTGPKFGGKEVPPMPVGRREWFAKRYLASIHKLNEYMALSEAQEYQGLVSDFLDALFHGGDSVVANTLSKIL